MTYLCVYTDDETPETLQETGDPAEITAALKEIDVLLRTWDVVDTTGFGAEEILAAYQSEIDRVTEEEAYILVDVAQLHPSDSPEWASQAAAARQKFLSEHT